MAYTIRKTNDLRLIAKLDHVIFGPIGDTAVELDNATWWVAYANGSPVAFAGLSKFGGCWFLRRVGVVTSHRGNGLQKRLIKVRVKHAKRADPKLSVVTYTVLDNHPSSNNLIATGFRLYEPSQRYVGKVLYWRFKQPKD